MLLNLSLNEHDRTQDTPRDRIPISKVSSLQQHRQMGVLMRGCSSSGKTPEDGEDAPPIPNAQPPKAADEDVPVDRVAVTDDVSRLYFPTIGLGELARNPFRRWVRGHFQPQYLAAIVMQYQQSVEQSERDCRDHDEFHRREAD